MEVTFCGSHKSSTFDLEAIEMATRTAMHQLGAKMLEKLLSGLIDYEQAVSCDCGQQAQFHEMRPKQILTVLARLPFSGPIIYACIVIKGRVHATRNWM